MKIYIKYLFKMIIHLVGYFRSLLCLFSFRLCLIPRNLQTSYGFEKYIFNLSTNKFCENFEYLSIYAHTVTLAKLLKVKLMRISFTLSRRHHRKSLTNDAHTYKICESSCIFGHIMHTYIHRQTKNDNNKNVPSNIWFVASSLQ